MPVKSINTVVYVDSNVVGSGVVKYIDESAPGSSQSIVNRCDQTSIYIDGVEVGYVNLCHEDYVTYGRGGVRTVDISLPVYVDGSTVGNGNFTIEDEYGPVRIRTILTLTVTPQ